MLTRTTRRVTARKAVSEAYAAWILRCPSRKSKGSRKVLIMDRPWLIAMVSVFSMACGLAWAQVKGDREWVLDSPTRIVALTVRDQPILEATAWHCGSDCLLMPLSLAAAATHHSIAGTVHAERPEILFYWRELDLALIRSPVARADLPPARRRAAGSVNPGDLATVTDHRGSTDATVLTTLPLPLSRAAAATLLYLPHAKDFLGSLVTVDGAVLGILSHAAPAGRDIGVCVPIPVIPLAADSTVDRQHEDLTPPALAARERALLLERSLNPLARRAVSPYWHPIVEIPVGLVGRLTQLATFWTIDLEGRAIDRGRMSLALAHEAKVDAERGKRYPWSWAALALDAASGEEAVMPRGLAKIVQRVDERAAVATLQLTRWEYDAAGNGHSRLEDGQTIVLVSPVASAWAVGDLVEWGGSQPSDEFIAHEPTPALFEIDGSQLRVLVLLRLGDLVPEPETLAALVRVHGLPLSEWAGTPPAAPRSSQEIWEWRRVSPLVLRSTPATERDLDIAEE